MAKQRVVNTRFWDDDYVMDLDPTAKLLFLYCITNPLTDLCGAYEITLRRMAFDTGLKVAKIETILDKFKSDGKMLFRDGWLVIANFSKHQQGNSPKVAQGVARSLSGCPDWVKDTLSKGIDTLSIGGRTLTLTSGENLDSVRQPEPEPTEEETPQAASPKKGTRLSEPFLLTSEMRKYAAEKRPEIDVTLETEKFCNYWRAKTGRDATKLDWIATWRNWILNARSNGNGTHRPHGKRTDADVFAESADFYDNYPS